MVTGTWVALGRRERGPAGCRGRRLRRSRQAAGRVQGPGGRGPQASAVRPERGRRVPAPARHRDAGGRLADGPWRRADDGPGDRGRDGAPAATPAETPAETPADTEAEPATGRSSPAPEAAPSASAAAGRARRPTPATRRARARLGPLRQGLRAQLRQVRRGALVARPGHVALVDGRRLVEAVALVERDRSRCPRRQPARDRASQGRRRRLSARARYIAS